MQWSGAPVACLPDRAQRWDDNNPQQPCHCPPADYCPDIPDIKPENLNFVLTFERFDDSVPASAVLNGSEVPDLANGTVLPSQLFEYNAAQIKQLLFQPILDKFHIDTRVGQVWKTTVDLQIVSLDGLSDWANDALRLPVLLASRCCDSICPPGMQPTNVDKEILKPKDPDEGIQMSLADIEDLADDLGDVKSDLQKENGLTAQVSTTATLITTLEDYVDTPDPSKFDDLKDDLSNFNTKIDDAAVPAKIKNDHADTLGKAEALATQIDSEIAYRNNPEYITVQTITCTKVVNIPREGCLIAGTEITLADGSKKAIEELTLDDVVKGNEGPAKIIALSKFTQREEFMYSINGGEAFFTIEHPVLTPKGWKSVDATVTSVKSGAKIIGSLRVGDTIMLEGGKQLEVTSIEKVAEPGGISAYNLSVEGDGSFIANGFIMKSFKKMQMHY